jgi:DNA ligase-1
MTTPQFKPMKPPSGTLEDDELTSLRYPLYGSYKLDGIRASVQNGTLLSSTLKPIPNRDLQKLWGRPEYNGLDGEIVVGEPFGEGVFNRTTSLVMSMNRPAKDVIFYIFDKYDKTLDYEQRLLNAGQQLLDTCADSLYCPITLHSFRKLHNRAELETFEGECRDLGYEGMMLRKPNGYYKQGRSSLSDLGLLRRKFVADGEAIITGMFEERENRNEATVNGLGRTKRSSHQAGKIGKGTLGGFHVTGLTVFQGVKFRVGSFGGDQIAAELWANREKLVGKILKFKYQKYGSKDSPRQPIALGIRDQRDMTL